MNPTTPCQDRIQMAVEARARAILRRVYCSGMINRFTAEEYNWLKQQMPSVVTDTSVERALRLAGPAFSRCVDRAIAEFYYPENPVAMQQLVQSVLAEAGGEDME